MISLIGVTFSIANPIINANPVFNWQNKITKESSLNNLGEENETEYTKGELLSYMEEQNGEVFSNEELKETMEKYNNNVLNAKFLKDIGVVYYNHDEKTFELTVTTNIYKATLNAYIMGLDVDPKTWNKMQLAFAKISETISTDMGDNYLFSIVRPNNEDIVIVYSNGEVIDSNMNSGDTYINKTPLLK